MDYKKEYNERKAAVIELLKGCINFYTGLEKAEQVSTLEDLESNVKNGRFSIVVVGQFSAGKSTFLNSLMGEKYLPSFTTETTATVNFLRSVNESPTGKSLIRVNYKGGDKEECDDVTLENIEKFVSTRGDNVAQKIESVEVFLDSPYLNDGVSLVDSPGLNGVLEGHEQITNDQIDRSHAAIFMFNAKQPGSKTDYEKLNHLLKRCNSVLIVLNQKDLIKESEQTMEEVVDTLKKNYSKWFDTKDLPEIFPISAYQALVARSARSLDYNRKENFSESERKQLLDSSEIEKFEDRLTRYLTQGEKARKELLSPVEKVRTFLRETEASLSERIEELTNTTDADEVRLQISQLKDELDSVNTQLEKKKSGVRLKVGEILRDAERTIKVKASDEKYKCINEINGAEDLEDLEHNTRIYINRIYSRYAFIWDEVSEEADRRFHELIETEYSEYALSIVERLQQQEKDNGFEIKKKTMDQGYFDMDLDIDDWLTKRAAIQQEINQSEERLSDLQIKEIQANKAQKKREKLEQSRERLREEKFAETQLLGARPDVVTYTTPETQKRGGLLGLLQWAFTGDRDKSVTNTKRDFSDREYYDQCRKEIDARFNSKAEDLEREIRRLESIDASAAALDAKREENRKQRLLQEIEELKAEHQAKMAKEQRRKQRAAEAYVESLIEDIEKENLSQLYQALRNSKTAMTNAALDVLKLELTEVINRKKEDIELRERQLSASQEERNQIIEQLSAQRQELTPLMNEADSCFELINGTQVDTIKRKQ